MKKIIMLLSVFSICCIYAQEKNEQKLNFYSGLTIEPQMKNQNFFFPVLLSTSIVWEEHVKFTLSGGYILSQEVNAPLLVAELGYEFENNFEPYMKGEQIYSKHDVMNYYAVGLAYNIKINKKITLFPFSEYGREHHEAILAIGIHCVYRFGYK